MGAYGWHLTLLDANGIEVGPSGGTDQINGGPKPNFSDLCPPGTIAVFTNTGTTSNPVWTLTGCEGGMDFVLPGGTVVPGVTSVIIQPLGASSLYGPIAECRITQDGGTFSLAGVHATHACPSDFNLDGFVTGDDADAFGIEFYSGSAAADFNGDGFTTGDDADAFYVAFEAGC